MRGTSLVRTVFAFCIACWCAAVMLHGLTVQADEQEDTDKIVAVLDRECVNLKKDALKGLLFSRFSGEIRRGLSPEFMKIMEGVVKRTDFDNISEEKTAEIIGLVFESYKKGAPLEYLDEIFDVAYAKTISVDSLTAAAKALQEFHHSDVPQEIAEEFVYHSLEDAWDPAAMPILTRGMIYGVDRGLTPQRTALIIMLDVDQGALRSKSPDQLVLDAIKLVREKEPGKWKPLKSSEREMAEKQEQRRKLEVLERQAEETKRRQEADRAKAEEALNHAREEKENAARASEQERIVRQIEAALKASRENILKYQTMQKGLDEDLALQQEELEREKLKRDQEREAERQQQVVAMQRNIAVTAKSGRLDVVKLYAAVDRYIGTPYRYGGDSDAGIDCSAFTRRVYRVENVELPRSSIDQSLVGFGIGSAIMKPGDLVFFDPSITGRISHVGVYLGNGVFAHASSSKGVTKSNIHEKYYAKRFVRANRILEL